MTDAHRQIRGFVTSLLTKKGDTNDLSDNESLVIDGRLDSLDVMQIVTFLEQEFEVDFSVVQFSPVLFDTVDSIVAITER